MTGKMLQFVTHEKVMPDKRKATSRVDDFNEIYAEFDSKEAETQAGRCSQCGVPFCQINCPLHNNIPDWLMLTAENRLEEAYELTAATNTFPEICGRICPQDRLCEGNCVIEKGFESVTIGAVEKHITETAFDQGWIKPITVTHELAQSVGIIGAGPAGLAAADMLRRRGYQITVYDRYDRVGGLMIYGIPSFKLEKNIVERRAELLRKSGINFVLNCEIGRDITFDDLRDKHDALLIATGVYKPRDLKIPGIGLEGVIPALDYLTAANRKSLGDDLTSLNHSSQNKKTATQKSFDSDMLDAENKNLVVIGGGDTAMDCVRTAVRQKARSVTCLYRRDRANMPGSQREVENAEEEGVKFQWLSAPKALLGDNTVRAVKAQQIHLGQPDDTGRQVPQIIEGSDANIDADMVITALGFDPEDLPSLFKQKDLAVNRWGTIKIDWKTMMSEMAGVFAAGDIVRGASLVVWGIRDGRDAAEQIALYLEDALKEEMGPAEEKRQAG